MPGNPRKAFEALAGDGDAEVPAFPSAGMAGVQVAVVLNRERFRRERVAQGRFDVGRGDAHTFSFAALGTGSPGAGSGSGSSMMWRET